MIMLRWRRWITDVRDLGGCADYVLLMTGGYGEMDWPSA